MIYRCAGVLRLDPGPFTLGELIVMAEAHQEAEWARTGEILAAHYNALRDPKKRKQPYTGRDFNPFAKKTKTKCSRTVSVAELYKMIGRV